MATTTLSQLGTVTVRLGLDHANVPFARPHSSEAWTRPDVAEPDGDTVRFTCEHPFIIAFPGSSPFPENRYEVSEPAASGMFELEVATVPSTPPGRYKYDLTVAGQFADPDIVVRKDPR